MALAVWHKRRRPAPIKRWTRWMHLKWIVTVHISLHIF